MPRRIALIDLVGLSPALIGPHTPAIASFAREKGGVRTMRPTLPAVTTSVQTSMLTGVGPAEHERGRTRKVRQRPSWRAGAIWGS